MNYRYSSLSEFRLKPAKRLRTTQTSQIGDLNNFDRMNEVVELPAPVIPE
jgi:hypothetical protein